MATILDVARRAGVATSTVSHVLNGTRFVSADTTRAVHEAVLAVGYTPNTLARALARSSTSTIGLAVSSSRNRFFADMINAIEEECAKLGMMVLLANTHDEPDREAAVVAALHQRRVDGIIIAPCCEGDGRALRYLLEKQIPAVMVDRLPDVPLDGVGVENREALAEIVEHLVGHGHRRIGFLGGQAAFTTTREREAGFLRAMAAHELTVHESDAVKGLTELEAARAAALGLLSRREPMTALIGGNNLTTIGIMLAVRERGLHVPDDVSVAGFDDFEWAEAFEPQLTAMVQPCRLIGQTAAALLKTRIDAPAGQRETIRVPPSFAVRTSCGCLAHGRGTETRRSVSTA